MFTFTSENLLASRRTFPISVHPILPASYYLPSSDTLSRATPKNTGVSGEKGNWANISLLK